MAKVKKKKSARKRPVPRYTAKTSDKHELYQLSVQDPEFEVTLLDRLFRRQRGRKALSMREDFCGTALFCSTWVKSHKERTAVGVDISKSVLAWGKKHNVAPLGESASRVTLLQQNVLEPIAKKFDACVAFNFSYWCFKERAVLLDYFRNVRRCLNKDGVFFLDAYGGYESYEPDLEEPRKVEGGFTYIWHQDKVCPITGNVLNHIHFEFKDKSKLRKAFSYDWRFWTLPEIQELLKEAGFKNVTVYWEDGDEDGDGTGVYRPRKTVVNEAGWVAYLVAQV